MGITINNSASSTLSALKKANESLQSTISRTSTGIKTNSYTSTAETVPSKISPALDIGASASAQSASPASAKEKQFTPLRPQGATEIGGLTTLLTAKSASANGTANLQTVSRAYLTV